MSVSGRIRRRLALAIVLTALIPVLAAILLADSAIRKASDRAFDPEIGQRLDESLDLHKELARTVKASMRNAASAIAENAELRAATAAGDRAAAERALALQLAKYPGVVSLTVLDANGRALATRDRGRPLDPNQDYKLEVIRPLGEPAARRGVGLEAIPEPAPGPERPAQAGASAQPEEGDDPEADDLDAAEEIGSEPAVPRLVAVFAADKTRFEALEEMSQFVDTYRKIERQRYEHEAAYLYAFALLLGITIVAAIGVGTLLAQGVSSRIGELANATKRVGAGDLAVRVPEDGSDEIADLARAFNRMLGEVESSRARIEYLQRIGAWQEMARRLAHEIKNPLTPIQLAVQEIHRRYPGSEEGYRKLLDTTLEIVEDEVGTLRRLVSEFSGFARLPQARLEPADLAEFLREQRERISLVGDELVDGELGSEGAVLPRGVELDFELPDTEAPVNLDQQMLRRALINLIRNAGQAADADGSGGGRIVVKLSRDGDYYVIDVDDNGPGIAEEMRHTVFDPYVTTKHDGTGLGLAIVKKIVVEHGGSINADQGPLGGARMRLRIPAAGSAAASAVLEARDWQAPPSSARPSGRRGSIASA
jgi:two-component system, NtrC family, nitrogen regulation sensor histidine kinase NtrY